MTFEEGLGWATWGRAPVRVLTSRFREEVRTTEPQRLWEVSDKHGINKHVFVPDSANGPWPNAPINLVASSGFNNHMSADEPQK